MWGECLNIAYSIPLPQPEIASLAIQLAGSLMERRQFIDAARLYIDYQTEDTGLENAVNALSKGYHFTEAIRIVNAKHGPTKIPTLVHPAIIDCFSQTMELISELKAQLNAQVPRLRILREKKVEDPENYFEGNVTTDIDVPDDISVVATEAMTSTSLFTRYTPQSQSSRGTRPSSKNRRREERKRARGKKGTIYEEEYLVNSVGRLIQRTQDVREDVSRLVSGLMMIDKRFEAGECQMGFQRLVEEIRGCVGEVFEGATMVGRVSREGVEEVSVVREVPVVEPFEGSILLV
jgi:elongator complex protein 1